MENASNGPPPGFGSDFGPLGKITPPFHACRLIEAAADDALKRHQAYLEQLYADQEIKPQVSFRDLEFYCWPQVWESTACGFPGVGGGVGRGRERRLMRCLIEHASGWKEAPEELRPAFALQEATLRMMLAVDVGWTGMIFTVYREPQPKFRVLLLENEQHIVDVTGHGHDLRVTVDGMRRLAGEASATPRARSLSAGRWSEASWR